MEVANQFIIVFEEREKNKPHPMDMPREEKIEVPQNEHSIISQIPNIGSWQDKIKQQWYIVVPVLAIGFYLIFVY